MAYQVMARKWRPSAFDQVVAQEHVTRTLANAVSQDKIGHAYLFCGPRGVGKTSTARSLAKSLNCVEGPTPTPCLNCKVCKAITDGRSLDVLEIDGASNNGVDEVRALRESVGYAPQEGKYRVYIIDEVHMLSQSAFNALLKTLEEPPAHVIFMFATTEPQKIPATVLSRCQRFDFRRIPTTAIVDHLNSIIAAEGYDVEPDAIHFIARKADGAMRDAQSLLDQILSFSEGTVTQAAVAEVIGAVDSDTYFQLMEHVAQSDSGAALWLLNHAIDMGGGIEEFFGGLMEHIRNLLVGTLPEGAAQIEAHDNERARYINQAEMFGEHDLLRMLNLVSEAEWTISRSGQPRVRAELTVLKLVHLPASVDLKRLLTALESSDSQSPPSGAKTPEQVKKPATSAPDSAQQRTDTSAQAPLADQATAPTATPVIQPASLESMTAGWDSLLKHIGEHKKSLEGTLGRGRPMGYVDGVLSVGLPKITSWDERTLAQEQAALIGLVGQFFDGISEITLIEQGQEQGQATPRPESAKMSTPRQQLQELTGIEAAAINSEPIIGALKTALNLKIIGG